MDPGIDSSRAAVTYLLGAYVGWAVTSGIIQTLAQAAFLI